MGARFPDRGAKYQNRGFFLVHLSVQFYVKNSPTDTNYYVYYLIKPLYFASQANVE